MRGWKDGRRRLTCLFAPIRNRPLLRQGKHVVMTDGVRVLTIPRHNPVNAITMGVSSHSR